MAHNRNERMENVEDATRYGIVERGGRYYVVMLRPGIDQSAYEEMPGYDYGTHEAAAKAIRRFERN